MLGDHRAKRLSLHSEILLLKGISQQDLEEEQNRFPRFFSLIRNRTLDHTVYEQLFRETVRRAEIYEGRVEFSTVAGNISIPRIRKKRRNFFPEWEIRIPDGRTTDNFFSNGHPPIEVIFFCHGPGTLLRTDHFVFKTEEGK